MKNQTHSAPPVLQASRPGSIPRILSIRRIRAALARLSLTAMLLTPIFLTGCSTMEMSYKDFSEGKPITDMAVKVETPILFATVDNWEIAFTQSPDGSQTITTKGNKTADANSWIELLGAALIGLFAGGVVP